MLIGIVTWSSYHNYGTLLQAFALQKIIENLGHKVYILDDYPLVLNAHKEKFISKIKKEFFRFNRNYRKFEKCKELRDSLFEKFKSDFLILEKNIFDIDYLNSKYDLIVCGSDQIWNPYNLSFENSEFYYATFFNNRKITYAPSIGVNFIPDFHKERFSTLVRGFSHYSAREPIGKKIIGEIVKNNVELVVDPTLLIDSQLWRQMVVDAKNVEKYVLVYFLSYNNIFYECVKQFCKRNKLKLKVIYNLSQLHSDDVDLVTAGPLEFLQLINDAEYFFTDSFHGTIFSYIYKTEFYTFRRFKQSLANSQNSRIENLLNMMHLSDRLIGENNLECIGNLDCIRFNSIEFNLQNYIISSRDFIYKSINNE